VDSLTAPLDLAIDKDEGLKFLRHLTFWIGPKGWRMNGLGASNQFALQLRRLCTVSGLDSITPNITNSKPDQLGVQL
jgi:hypothetical protein